MRITKKSAQQIVEEIGKLVRQNINLMDETGHIIASNDPARIGKFHEGAYRIISQHLPEFYITPELENELPDVRRGINLPIVVDGQLQGVIGITGDYDAVIEYGQIVKKMAEILIRERSELDNRQLDLRVRSRFLEDWILGTGLNNPRTLSERGFALGIDIRSPRRCIVASAMDREKYTDSLDGQMILESVASAGDSAVVITLSSKLSGTYQSAVLAAEDYPNIYVVDSQSVAIGTGVLAQYAVELAQQGMGAEEIAQVLTQQREKVCVVALLDTLEYLKKGGRISKTVAFAGGMLNIKPVVTVQDGAVALIGKARGSRNGNNLLVEKIREAGGVDFERPVLLGYTGLSSALLEKYVDDSKALWADHVDKLDGCLLCSVIGTHAGPGAVAVAFFRKG